MTAKVNYSDTSVILPEYGSGDYFADANRHAEDAAFKIQYLADRLFSTATSRNWTIRTVADVGCGSGSAIKLLVKEFRSRKWDIDRFFGLDVYPQVELLNAGQADVVFSCEDFVASSRKVDLVVLLDVFEHVPAPVEFLREVQRKAKYVALHVPLDNTLLHVARDRFRAKLENPGHLVFLDAPQALTLMTLAGLRVVDYIYTPGFDGHSGAQTRASRILRVARRILFRISPGLLTKYIGGCSLLVLAETSTLRVTQT